MALTQDEIIERIKNPVCKLELQAGISIQNKHKIHVTGEGYEAKLTHLVGFESKDDFDIRTQLTGPGTMQLTALILDNLNRWVTMQGTVKVVQFKQEKQDIAFKKVLDQIWRGNSLEDFISTFYKEAIYQEMEGFLLITKPQIITGEGVQIRDGIALPYEGEELNPYMIFIAAEEVKDFNAVGDHIEYIIFEAGITESGDKIYRFIDNEKDLLVMETNDKLGIIEGSEMKNEIGYVPAIQISNIAKSLNNEKVKTSPIDHVIPALNRYMNKDSDLIIQMVRHMYPKLASVTTPCKQCDGDGKIYFDDNTKTKKCKDCNGTGKVIPITREGILGLPQYIDEGKTPYPGSPASYIAPDNASLETARTDLSDLGKDILYSATGDKNLIVEGLETATENLINFKGLEDRIAEIVDMVESREEFIIETAARMHLSFKEGFKGVSVRYGRRLTIRGESEILTEITAAKTAGMPTSHIEALQKELLLTRYKNNKVELERNLLLADVEPLNGYETSEILDIVAFVSEDDLKIKFNYNRIVDIFESKNGPVILYQPKLEWKKRVTGLYEEFKTISDEILLTARVTGQD